MVATNPERPLPEDSAFAGEGSADPSRFQTEVRETEPKKPYIEPIAPEPQEPEPEPLPPAAEGPDEDLIGPTFPVTTRRWSRSATVTVLVVVALVAALVIQRSISGSGSGAPHPALATASLRSFPITATATGTVVPASEIGVNFMASGQLVEIDVKAGDQVAKGAVLAKVDPNMANLEVAIAQAAINSALNSNESVQAHAALAKALADLAATSLLAPVAGTVEAVNGQVGETVQTAPTASQSLPGTSAPVPTLPSANASPSGSQPLVVLNTGTGVLIGAAFLASDAAPMMAGQKGILTSETISGVSDACHVVARDSAATLINGMPRFWVSIAPDNPDPRLLAGVPVQVSITTGQATSVVAVPSQAIYVLDGQSHVDVWFKNHSVPTVVTTGLTGSQLVQIKSGLAPGQQVVLAGSNGLPPAASTPNL